MSVLNGYADMKSILEVPVLTEKYLDKARGCAADAVMLDLEDSAPTDRKEEARQRAADILSVPGAFGKRKVFVRINNLDSDWGLEDIEALSRCRADFAICYPKVETRTEMERLVAELQRRGGARSIYAMIETPRALIELETIASCETLAGLHFGYMDFANEIGCELFCASGDDFHQSITFARSKIATVAAAFGLFSTGGSMIPELKDLQKVETFVRSWKAFGYTACLALSPTHLDVVNRVFRPSEETLETAKRVCAAFEDATRRGALNAVLDGKIITLPDYRNALSLVQRSAN